MKETLRGYRISGRVARPSQVVVGEYAAAEEISPTAKTQPMPVVAAAAVVPAAPEPAPAEPVPAQNDEETLEEILARIEPHLPKPDEDA
jgi:hypothetical protein